MSKPPESPEKCCIQTEKHSVLIAHGLCSLLEHQSLVDIAVCCGSNILLAHKIVLAANSPLFRVSRHVFSKRASLSVTG